MGQQKSSSRIQSDLNAITRMVEKHECLFVACGFDKADNLHLSDIGMPKEVHQEVLAEYLETLCRVIRYYFDLNNLEKSKAYALKFYAEADELFIEYFTSLEEILPTLKVEA
tara:strand:+ start:2139 stop:2474 length:336 start_codon:yes stop_codon:yes gene_type:complete